MSWMSFIALVQVCLEGEKTLVPSSQRLYIITFVSYVIKTLKKNLFSCMRSYFT